MPEHLLFLTGRLAEPFLRRVLEQMQPTAFTYTVHQLGLQVAALMTADMIRRRLDHCHGADRIIVPGRCRGDLQALSEHLGVPVERGPEELRDLPAYFGHDGQRPDLSGYRVQIFAEIVDAPRLSVEQILERARGLRAAGADVIDLGCLPQTPFPHLEASVRALKSAGMRVAVDSMQPAELIAGGRAGADYLLSLTEHSLEVLDQVSSTPVLIPAEHGDLESLARAAAAVQARGRDFILDSILDPIHFGFSESLARYRELRRRFPRAELLMGVGNVTELTDADTAGINALLLGIASELDIGHILTTQVSPHARNAVREADLARRIMYAAARDGALPRDLDPGLLRLHERAPFPYTPQEIEQMASTVRDPSFRIQVSEAGIHVYNRDGMRTGTDPFALYPRLGVDDDAGHAFYLGVELGRAEIAWTLGKRYVQDQPLRWGCVPAPGYSEPRPGDEDEPPLDDECIRGATGAGGTA